MCTMHVRHAPGPLAGAVACTQVRQMRIHAAHDNLKLANQFARTTKSCNAKVAMQKSSIATFCTAAHILYTRARQNYHFSVRVGPALDPDFPILELKTFPHMCGTYSADKYCGSWPRQPMPPRPTFSIGFPMGFPQQTPPG